MKFRYEIPQAFWGLFRSVNREIYIEALLAINEEYQYSNYFLSREACLQVLSDMYRARRFAYEQEETESEEEVNQSVPRRILNWLLKAGWLRRVEDYNTMSTNIVIPDYASLMIEAFENLLHEPQEDTQVYIQNVYATLFSFRSDSRMNIAMLKTALINTRKLNKALQDMLHNMDKFFDRLLNARNYSELLREHLDGYVEEVVKKKYHILKTSDNFYIYKMDIKRCLKEMREDGYWIEQVRKKQQELSEAERNTVASIHGLSSRPESTQSSGSNVQQEQADSYFHRRHSEDVLDLIDQIERGFDDIEQRIANMDKEHSKYVRATVSRLNYLLREEDDRKGLMVQLLHKLGSGDERRNSRRLSVVAEHLNLSGVELLHESPLYKRRNPRKFEELVEKSEEQAELSREEVLQLNQIHHRFTRQQIEAFLEEHLEDGIFYAERLVIRDDETFEKLILAYDMCMRKNSRFQVFVSGEQVSDGHYSYPGMMFVKKQAQTLKSANEVWLAEGSEERNEE